MIVRPALRWLFIVVVTLHGLVHLLGAVEGLGLADVDQITLPISVPMGVLWLVAAFGVLAAAALAALRVRWWWLVVAAAAAVSQAVILTSWDDAKAGTVANLIMLLAAGYGYAAQGPSSLRADYRRQVDAALRQAPTATPLTDADVAKLPAPVAEYVRRSGGAVGRPRVTAFRARIRGRIRSGPDKPWMTFTGEQVNTYGTNPSRLFFIDATMRGLPVDVYHCFTDQAATMRVRLCSLVPIVTASGPDATRAETVTLFNDLCIMAPGALMDAPVSWEPLDAHRVRGTYSLGEHTIAAELVFNDCGDLVDFISEDRLRAAPDGKTFVRMPWSTPVDGYQRMHGRRIATRGEAVWHPAPEGRFAYLEFSIDDIVDNLDAAPTRTARTTAAL